MASVQNAMRLGLLILRPLALCVGTAALGGCLVAGVDRERLEEEFGAQSRDELLAALDGHADPIATYLRDAASEAGTIAGDYRAVLRAVGQILGCEEAADRSFAVLTNLFYLPRIVFAACADEPGHASRFFMNASAFDGSGDLDRRVVYMAAWDEKAGAYRHYATRPAGEGMRVQVEPGYCMACHGGRFARPAWMPLMNEMVAPWSQWLAEPEAPSQLFHEHLDPAIAAGAAYREMTREGLVASVAELEPIVRAGIERVVAAQVERAHEARGAAAALELVRPLFCDEELDYVSELDDSGRIPLAAAVDPNLAVLLNATAPDAGWPWLERAKLRLSPPEGDSRLALVPVRAELSRMLERDLVSRGVLSADVVLRVRALDWRRPALSPLRCRLYVRGRQRFENGAAVLDIPGGTAAQLADVVVRELLHVPTEGDALVALAPIEGDLLAIEDAADPDVVEKLASGELGAFDASYAELAGAVQQRVNALEAPEGRDRLAGARLERVCRAVRSYSTVPLYPERVVCR